MMFREMRRKDKLLSKEETIRVLERCTSGVLAVTGDDGYPYTVPLSYVMRGDKLFFHCANTGHKIDGIRRNDKVTFCVIDRDNVIPEDFNSIFRSAVVFGRARILTDDSEKRYALECLAEKYSPDYMEKGKKEIEDQWDRVCAVEIKIEHMTGKAAPETIQ